MNAPEEKQKSPATRPDITLGEFIEENQKLLSVLGVFTALTVFTLNLPIKVIGYALSFVFLSIVVLLWWEIRKRVPKDANEWPVRFFNLFVSLAMLGTAFYYVAAYRKLWEQMLPLILMLLLVGPVFSFLMLVTKQISTTRKFRNWVASRSIAEKRAIATLLIVISLLVSFVIGEVASPFLNVFLEVMESSVQNVGIVSNTPPSQL